MLTRRAFAVFAAVPALARAQAVRTSAAKVQIPPAYRLTGTNDGFAFALPDGTPAGAGVQFPPLDRPLPAGTVQGDGVVLCTRLRDAAGLEASPVQQLANTIIDTSEHRYKLSDGSLQVGGDGGDDERFVSLVDERSRTGVSALLSHVAGAAYYYGTVRLERPALDMTMYIAAGRIGAARDCLALANRLLQGWEVR